MRILLIEDDMRTADFAAKGFSETGHLCEVLANGRDALVQATREPCDILVVDRMLPGLDGLSLFKAIRAAGVKVPVIFLTSIGGVDDRVEGLEAGGDDYLVKPFACSELLARVNALGRRPPVQDQKTQEPSLRSCRRLDGQRSLRQRWTCPAISFRTSSAKFNGNKSNPALENPGSFR